MLAAISLGMSSYAVYQVTMDEKGRTNINPFYKPHQVDGNKQYRMWNPVSMSNDGLLQLNPFDGNVYCNGSFSNSGSEQGLSTVKTSEIEMSQNEVSLLFNISGQVYALTVDTTQNALTVLPYSSGEYPTNSRFKIDYYWSYTFFPYKLDNTTFLGCDGTGRAMLVDGMQFFEYPNPQALFILNEV
ncbi:uncharacterized protein [Porites lutea]|uniref:uncharacterized protein n=1 Tax=Porites lutea TaxID=51062 RepID=UPI003CC52794